MLSVVGSIDSVLFCRIDGSYLVKIADFGMSRDIYEKDYYKMEDQTKPVPMKWMALESLKEGKYTTNSDVVSVVVYGFYFLFCVEHVTLISITISLLLLS